MIVYCRINEGVHCISTRRYFYFHHARSCRYLTSWIVAGNNLQCFTVFLTVKVRPIESNYGLVNYAEFSDEVLPLRDPFNYYTRRSTITRSIRLLHEAFDYYLIRSTITWGVWTISEIGLVFGETVTAPVVKEEESIVQTGIGRSLLINSKWRRIQTLLSTLSIPTATLWILSVGCVERWWRILQHWRYITQGHWLPPVLHWQSRWHFQVTCYLSSLYGP